ncbi:glycosyltransferase [Deinococcus apachensis]|uniref:glycosyltransferase n=1 Tax=Deinococcus apachensis TaxID=309886 RepID=UPI0003778EBB|nr:glycosyltransferase [Deinococcus apachensis]
MSLRVAIFREKLLPYSETFIPAQASALQRYTPILVGLKREPRTPSLSIPTQVLSDEAGYSKVQTLQLYLGQAPQPWVQALRQQNLALMHAHFGVDGVWSLPLARALNIPLITTFHGYDVFATKPFRRVYRYYQWRRPALFRQASRIIAVSNYVREGLLALGCPPQKVVTHYIGINLKDFVPAPVEREPIILSVGRLIERKGVLDLIRVMPNVQQAIPNVRLVIIGSGELEGAARAEASRLGVRAEFLGPQTPAQVREWMNRAAIFCLPSRLEAFGMVFAEAQTMGLPVAAYADGGVPEAVKHGETGFLTPPGDQDALTNSLITLLRDEALRRRMGEAGRARVQRLFEIERQTRELERLYDACLT